MSNLDQRNRIKNVLVIMVASFIMLSITCSASAVTITVGHTVDADYWDIQDAINASNDSDTIQVWYGTYNEHIVINKSLTVESRDGTGDTFIDSMGSGVVVDITSDNVTFEGFTVQNGRIGIQVTGSNNLIVGNSITKVVGVGDAGYAYAVYMYSTNNVTICGNAVSNVRGSDSYDQQYSCTGPGGCGFGITLHSAANTKVFNNTISDVTGGNGGRASSWYCTGGDGGNGYGIYITSSTDNILSGNTVSDVHGGAGGSGPKGYGSSGKGYGIAAISDTNRNIIYHNNIENSDTRDGYDSGGNNAWDGGPTFGGNYWNDYPGNDADGDGIGDTPYDLGGGIGAKDYYPFMNKNGWVPDTEPPASITNLTNATYEQTHINWTWTNPNDADFNHIMVFIDGAWQTNTTSEYYNATGFTPGTSHEIATHTVDVLGNVNTSWVNHTATTAPVISVRGDLNGDGILTPADAAIALRLAASGAHDSAADVSGDGSVTSLDALMILQAAADTIEL